MSDTDLKEKEAEAVDPGKFEDEFGQDFSNDEKDRLDDLSDQVGGGYRSDSTKTNVKVGGRRRNKIIGGVVGIAAIGGIVSSIIFLPIMKLESYMSSINRRAFTYASSAVEARTQHLMEGYLINHILSLENCGNHITNDCRSTYGDKGMAGKLYSQWRDAKVEQRLFDQYHIKVETNKNPDPATGKYRVVLKDANDHQMTVKDGKLVKDAQFMGGEREFGQEMRLFLRQNTKWYEVMQRRSIRNYLERKHGINKWCFLACAGRDAIDSKFTSGKTRYKYKFVEKFVYPFSGKYGFLLDCIISGKAGTGGCTDQRAREIQPDRTQLSDKEIQDIAKKFEGEGSVKLTEYIIDELVTKYINKEAAQATLSAVPIAGQVYFIAGIADTWDKMYTFIDNNGLSKYAADINSAQYLEYYTGMRSSADEIKSGALGLDDIGAIADDLNGAEQSKLYQSENNVSTTTASLFTDTAYAEPVDNYKCANGNPIPAGELVCNEKKVARTYAIQDIQSNEMVSAAKPIIDTYGTCFGLGSIDIPIAGNKCVGLRIRDTIGPLLKGINGLSDAILGPIVGGAMAAIKMTPFIGSAINAAMDFVGKFLHGIISSIFPLPVQVNSPGREKYDGMVAGSEVAARDFCQGDGSNGGLGCRKLTTTEAVGVLDDQTQQLAYNNSHSGLFDRITNLDNPDSVATHLAMEVPTSGSGGLQQVLASLTNAMANMFSLFTTFGHPATAKAAAAPQDAFGVGIYGYPVDSPALTADPDIYTPEYCAAQKAAHDASRTPNPVTGFDEYSVTDNCMLEQATIEAAGSYFTDN